MNSEQTIETDGLVRRKWQVFHFRCFELRPFVHHFSTASFLALALFIVEHPIVFDGILCCEIDGNEQVLGRQGQIARAVASRRCRRIGLVDGLLVGCVSVQKGRNAHRTCVDRVENLEVGRTVLGRCLSRRADGGSYAPA